MNNILNEITYSDERFSMEKTILEDNPAKLKLRSRTYDGIQRNLQKRKTPEINREFSIPNAYMAMEVPTGTEGSGNGGFQVLPNTTLEGKQANVIDTSKLKRLKVAEGQKDILKSKGNSASVEASQASVPTPTTVVQEQVQQPAIPTPEVNSVPPVAPTPTVTPQEQQTVVTPQPAPAAPVAPMPTPDLSSVAPATTEVVANPQPQEAVPDEADVFAQSEAFKKYQETTQGYIKMNEEIQGAKDQLEKEKKVLQDKQTECENIASEIKEKENTIEGQVAAIGEHETETAALRDKIAELEEKIKERSKEVQTAIDKLSLKKDEIVKQTSQVSEEQQVYQKKIEERKGKIIELDEKIKEYKEKEAKALEERNKTQSEYEQKLKQFESSEIPEEIQKQANEVMESQEVVQEKEETPEVETENEEESKREIVSIPDDQEIESSQEQEGPTMVKTLGHVA